MRFRNLAAGLALLLGTIQAEARDLRVERIHIPHGQQTVEVQDLIVGYEAVSYRVHGIVGETLQVNLNTADTQTYFNVYGPGQGPGDRALVVSEYSGPQVPEINSVELDLDETGDYTVSVYMVRAAARRGEVSRFALNVSLVGGPEVETAEAAQVTGVGMDHWVVDVSSRLRVHETPSTSSPVVASLLRGTAVRNLGCRRSGLSTWCEVERPNGSDRGWVSAQYLTASNTPLPSEDDTYQMYGHSRGWNILVRDDHNNGCLAEVERDGVQVQIGLDRRDMSTYLAVFTRDAIGAQEGKHLGVRFELDGGTYYGDLHEEKRGGYEGGYVHVANPAFITDIGDARELTVYAAGMDPLRIDLSGSKRAIGRIIECQMHH